MTGDTTHTESSTAPTAGHGPVDGLVRPRVWAIFVDSGNVRMWSTLQPHVQKLADAEGLEVTPLYDQAAIDAAVAADRRRCERLRAEMLRVQAYIDETPELFEALGPLDHGA